MKRFVQIGLWLLVGVAGVKGQNAIVGTGFSTGWGGGSCPTGNSDFNFLSTSVGGTYILTTTSAATGDRFWRFGVDWSGTTAQLTNSPGNNTVVTPNTTYNLNTGCTTNGALQYNVSSTSNNYVFKTLNAGTNPTGTWVFFEVQGAVRTISSVVQSPIAANVFPGQAVTVTANMSGTQSTGQNVFLRYTTGNFSTSTVVNMTYSGTTATATIPASVNSPGSIISYYVFTSGTANVASDGGNADLYTINLNNNGGSNYSYTVASGWTTAATGNWTTPGTWTANAVPPSAESMGTVNIGHAVTGDANALFSTLNINGTNTLTQNTGTTFTTTGSITINGGANYNMNGNLQINAGGFVNGTSGTLTYGASSTLIYNSGGNYGVNNEWIITATSGNRVPANITVGNGVNTQINFGVIDNQVRTLRGNLTINSGSTVTLSTGANSNLQVGGNFTNSGTFTPNSKSVIFNGTTAQTITGNTTFAAINNINGSTNAVSIANGTTVTLSTSGTFTTASSSFVVNGTLINNGNINLNNATAGITVNGTLTNTSTVTVTSGTLSFSATGIYNHNITGVPGTIPTATWHPSSNCNIVGALNGGTLVGVNQTFGNVTWNCPSQAGAVSFNGVTTNISGNFTIINTNGRAIRISPVGSSGTLNVSGQLQVQGGILELVNSSSAGNVTGTNITSVTGLITVSAGSLLLAGDLAQNSTGSITLNANGGLTVNGGTFNFSANSANTTVNLPGSFSFTSGTFTETGTGTGSVLNFTGGSNQSVNFSGTNSNTIFNFRLNNSAGITITGSLPINTGATFFRQAGSVTSGTIAYNATNSTLAYTGGSMTTENGEWPTTNGPVNVTLNTAAAADVITLHAARTLAATGVFTLTQGSMELNNNDLTISNTATNSLAGTGFGASKMIRTSGTGRLFRGIGTGTNNNYNFPIGETTVTTEYSPYELRMASNATAFQVGVRVVDGNAPNVNNPAAPSEYLSRHWLTSVGGSPTNYAYTAWLTFNNIVGDAVGGSTANLSVSEYNGSSWVAAATNVNVAVLEGSAGAFTQATAPLGTGEFTGRNNTINFTWTGATNNEWNVSTNWTPTGTPAATDIATVNSGGTPNISNGVNALVRDLTVAAGASLTVQSGGSLTIGGTLTTGGTFNFNCGSTVNFNSAVAQTIPALSYGNLNISGGNRTLAAGIINICGNFTPTAGTTTATGSTVRFNGTTAQSIQTNAGSFNNLTIANTAATVTSNVAITIASGAALTIDASARLDMATNSLTLTGTTSVVNGFLRSAGAITGATALTLNFSATGTYEHNFTTTAGTIPTATWSTGSTCAVIGYTTNLTAPAGLSGQTFSNFTWSCPNQANTINLSGALTSVPGNFSVLGTGSAASIRLRLFAGSGTLTIGGNLLIDNSGSTYSVLDGNNAATSVTINVAGSVTLNQTGTLAALISNGGTGNILLQFNGATNQAININGSITATTSYTLNNSAGITITGSLPVNNNATFTRTQGTVTGTVTYGTGTTLIYNNTAAVTQTGEWPAASGPVNLTISGTGGVTMSGSRTVAGTVTLSAAAGSLNLAGNTLTLNNGSTAQSIAGAGSNSFTISSSPVGGILSTTGTGDRTISLSNFGTTPSAGLVISVGATLQMNSNARLSVGGNGTTTSMLTIAGTLQLNSTTNSNIASGSAPFYTGTSTLEYRVNYGAFQEWLAGTALTTPGVPQNVLITSGAITIPAARSVLGNFTISGGSFTPSGTLTVTGNFTNSVGGNFIANSQEVIFNSSIDQNLTGTTTFFNMRVNKSGGSLILTGSNTSSLTFTNRLALPAGNIILGDNNITLAAVATLTGLADGTSVSSFSASNMIITGLTANTNGFLRRNVNIGTVTNLLWPVAESNDASQYSPVTMTGSIATVGFVGFKVTDGIHPNNGASSDYISRFWTLNTTAIASAGMELLATYQSTGDVVGNVADMRANLFFPVISGWLEDGASTVGGAYPLQIRTLLNNSTAGLSTNDLTGRREVPALYRTVNSGNWNTLSTWEVSINGGAYSTPAQAPNAGNSTSIIIRNGHTINTTGGVFVLDQTVIQSGGILNYDGGIVTLFNGSGEDLVIETGGRFTHTVNANIPALINVPIWRVQTGGTIHINTNSPGGQADAYASDELGTYAASMVWENGSIFLWQSTSTLSSTGRTYFVNAGLDQSIVPVLRFSSTPSLGVGSGSNTLVNGRLEANADVTFNNGGAKTFRNGIIGTATVTQSSTSGQFRINGTTSQLGVATLTLRNDVNSGLALQAGTCTLTGPVLANSGPIYIDDGAVMISDAVNAISGTASYTLNSGATLSTAHASGVDGTITLTNVSMNSGSNYIFNGTVNQATGTKMAASPGTVTINNTGGGGSNTVTLSNAGTTATTLSLTNGIFSIGNNVQFNIANNGAVNATSGSLASGNAAGTVNFLGTGTVNATATLNFWNVNLQSGSGGVNFGNAGSPTILNELIINSGRSINTNAPFYANTSTLVYNTGNTFIAGSEWYAVFTSGRGIPHHVQIGRTGVNNSILSFGTNTLSRYATGNITIGDGVGTGYNFSLSTSSGGDVGLGGNWILNNNASFTPNDREVSFAGNTLQLITGTQSTSFDFLRINNPAGVNMQLNTTAFFLTLQNGLFTPGAGRTLFIKPGGTISNSGNSGSLPGDATGGLIHFGGAGTVTASQTNGLLFWDVWLEPTATAQFFSFGSDAGSPTLLNTLTLNGQRFLTNAPLYGTGSTLIYNSGGTFDRNVEWGALSGRGYPHHVRIQNNTTVNFHNTNPLAFTIGIAGDLILGHESGFGSLNFQNRAHRLIVNRDVIMGANTSGGISNLILGNFSGGDLEIGRNFTRTANGDINFGSGLGRAVFFTGAVPATISAPAAQNFPFLIIDKGGSTANTLTLNQSVNVTQRLILTSGRVITSSSNLLRITNSAPDDASNGIVYSDVNPAYIDGPLMRDVNTTSGSNSYIFPVGRWDGSTHFAKRIRMKELTNGIGSFTVTYERGNPPGGNPPIPGPVFIFQDVIKGIRQSEYWNVDLTAGSTQGRIVLPYTYLPGNTWLFSDGSLVTPNIIARVAVVRGSGANWNVTDPLNSAFSTEGSEPEGRLVNTDGDISSRHIDAFSHFTFGWGLNQVLILPLKLLGFTAKATGPDVLLQWQYADAKDLAYTTIEYSTNGQGFRPLQRVAGTTALHYSHTHLQPGTGVHYYRLLMADKNGETSYSAVQVVQIGVNQSYITGLLQNPVQGAQAMVQGYSATAQPARVLLTDVQGRRLLAANYQVAQGSFSLPVSLLPVAKGNYYLQLMLNDGTSKTMKVVY